MDGALHAPEQPHQAVRRGALHVIDAVRSGGHPGSQAGDLHRGVHAARPGDPDVLRGQVTQARPLRQGHHRDQASVRHEARVIKRRVDLRELMQQSHLRGVLSSSTTVASATPIVPAQRAPFALTRPNRHLFTRWIQAKLASVRLLVHDPKFIYFNQLESIKLSIAWMSRPMSKAHRDSVISVD